MGCKTAVGVLMALAASLPAAAADSVESVLLCMRGNLPQTVRIQTVEVQAFDRGGGERQLKGRVYGTREKGRVRVMMRIESPPDLARAAYLVREADPDDEMHMYLPAMNKTRRITGAALDGKLWGTDLSYADFKRIQNAFDGAGATLEAPAEVEGRPVHVLGIAPNAKMPSRYEKIRVFVDQKTCVALKTEFFEAGAVRKQFVVAAKDLKQAGKLWYAAEAQMADVQEGTRTLIKITGVSAGAKLSASYFNPLQFYQGN